MELTSDDLFNMDNLSNKMGLVEGLINTLANTVSKLIEVNQKISDNKFAVKSLSKSAEGTRKELNDLATKYNETKDMDIYELWEICKAKLDEIEEQLKQNGDSLQWLEDFKEQLMGELEDCYSKILSDGEDMVAAFQRFKEESQLEKFPQSPYQTSGSDSPFGRQ